MWAFNYNDLVGVNQICTLLVILQISSARESTPEPVTAAKKKKGKKDKKKNDINEDDDEEFTIISKSKAHKDIKVDPKSSYGGDMYCPKYINLLFTETLYESIQIKLHVAFVSYIAIELSNFFSVHWTYHTPWMFHPRTIQN